MNSFIGYTNKNGRNSLWFHNKLHYMRRIKEYRRYIYTLRCFENFDVGTCECERCGSVTSWQVSRKTLSIKIFLFTFYIITSMSVNKRVMIISSKSFTHIDMCINDVIQPFVVIQTISGKISNLRYEIFYSRWD